MPVSVLKQLTILLLLLVKGCSPGAKVSSDWLLIYYMPYDNDLSGWTDSLLLSMEDMAGPGVSVSVHSDRSGDGGMDRYLFTDGRVEHNHVIGENSHAGSTLDAYLDWVFSKVESEKVAMIFLDHGGELDETGLDEFSENGEGFMKIQDIEASLGRLNNRRGKLTDLLFFQVCAKSSIEPLYQLRRSASYTLASQNLLGAPNYYYEYLKDLSPDVSAKDLAKAIVEGERSDMYYSLSLIDNAEWDPLITSMDRIAGFPSTPKGEIPLMIRYWENNYIDLRSFVKMYTTDPALVGEFDAAFDKLLVWHRINPADKRMDGYCGINILSPWDPHFPDFSEMEFYRRVRVKVFADSIRSGG